MNMASSTKLISLLKLFCLLFIHLQPIGSIDNDDLPHIGIIGAGIGGTSAAYFLRDLFGTDVTIDVFEQKAVGGRLATILLDDGGYYEAGGSIIHPRNMYMVNFTKLLGLKPVEHADEGHLGVFNGKDMVFATSNWKFFTLAKMIWKYGWNIFNIKTFINDKLLQYFTKIYDIQEEGYSFTTVTDLLMAMNESFVDLTKRGVKEVLKDEGFSDTFIDEFVIGALRMNYGQTLDLPAFVGFVSLLAAGEPALWSVQGGNKLVPEKLLKRSKATLIEGTVTKVTFQGNHGQMYEVEYNKKVDGKDADSDTREYDIVILATPLHDRVSSIQFENFPKPIHNFPQPFHQTVATFIQAKPSLSYFGYCEMCHFPDVLFTCNKDLFFNSIGKQHPVDSSVEQKNENGLKGKSVYKVFSNAVLTVEQLDDIFVEREDLKIADWLAYPQYTPGDELPPFVLHDQLYYINGIEIAASAMEMSAIGAKNVANLAFNHWTGNMDKIDEFSWREDSTKHDKTEL